MTKLTIDLSKKQEKELKGTLIRRGHTIHSWVSEQLELAIEESSSITAPGNLYGVDSLDGIDWAFTNEITSSFTHDIHPYPAKFIPQIPEHLICALSKEGDLVLDPFSGSCTTATEASRLGRNSISIDANPLSVVIGTAKTIKISSKGIKELDTLVARVMSYVPTLKEDSSEKKLNEILENYRQFVPGIPNEEKWFKPHVKVELAVIKGLMAQLDCKSSRSIADVALSRIVIKVSNQDSETRYTAVKNEIEPSETLTIFIDSLSYVIKKVKLSKNHFKYSKADFLLGDSRTKMAELPENSVDLIVTSPPYANATDYHLYHRFRIFWLGFDPRHLGKIEIGSHLKHQRNNSGYEEYESDMRKTLEGMFRVLRAGKYVALVVGDSIFKEKVYKTHKILATVGLAIGFEHVKTFERPLHETKRSFVKPGRRLRKEQIVILRKPDVSLGVVAGTSGYKLYDYEISLMERELAVILKRKIKTSSIDNISISFRSLNINSSDFHSLKKSTFLHELVFSDGETISTNQNKKESGPTRIRKNSTYFTHGMHAYKGKFYPQLALSLINIAGNGKEVKTLLDPFCGSGTAVMESFLTGNVSLGMDMNPIAISVARAKNEILTVDRNLIRKSFSVIRNELEDIVGIPKSDDQFPKELHEEIFSWFPTPVVHKLNFLLAEIRLFGDDRVVNYFEILLSSIVRNISQQDPKDLRIRKRKEFIEDAPVFELYLKAMKSQLAKLESFWESVDQGVVSIGSFKVGLVDNREPDSYTALGLNESSVDCIVTSPPYATALPYIDTDRLSILIINSLSSRERAIIEKSLTGSREIKKSELNALDELILAGQVKLPKAVKETLKHICQSNLNDEKAGFRKKNTASLLLRYFNDMKAVLENSYRVLKPGADAFFVVGDSKTQINDEWFHIETCDFILKIGRSLGFNASNYLDITVTSDNKLHSKNFIEKNSILKFTKPLSTD
jgi:DNA modification methylase